MGRDSSTRRRWSLEAVVAEIRKLHARGQLVSTSELVKRGHASLVVAAQHYAGGWRRAVRLAGVHYQTQRRRWTKDSVLEEIRRRHSEGKSLLATRVDTSLLLAAKKRFGAWRKARAAAVPSYDEGHEAWTEQKILDAIAALHARGISLSSKTLREMGEGRVVSAAVGRFGTWEAAQRRAVKDFVPILQSWTKQRVVAEIRARHDAGKSMGSTNVTRDNLRLVAAATRLFGGWPAAREAAGVPYRDPRNSWPAERIVAELRRHAVDGVAPYSTEIGQALYKVAKARFGSFQRACRAAGLRLRSSRSRGSREP